MAHNYVYMPVTFPFVDPLLLVHMSHCITIIMSLYIYIYLDRYKKCVYIYNYVIMLTLSAGIKWYDPPSYV